MSGKHPMKDKLLEIHATWDTKWSIDKKEKKTWENQINLGVGFENINLKSLKPSTANWRI